MNKILQHKWFLITGLVALLGVFFLLFYRAPYSNRTLVGNLEPYPDTLFYSQPAWNMVHGNGYVMEAYGYKTKIVTPPVYTFYLAPFFAVFDDIRSFYFANIILSFISVVMLLAIIRKVFPGKYSNVLMVTGGFLYLTNFYVFTLPTLLMAENITITLFLVMLYVLVAKITVRNSIIAGIIGIVLLGVKFSNLPLTATFYLIYLWRIYKETSAASSQMRSYMAATSASGVILATYIISSQILIGHKNLNANTSLNITYLLPNLKTYLNTLMGTPASFLWFYYPMVSSFVGILSAIGAIVGIASPKLRRFCTYILIISGAHILFGSLFYATDSRYITVLYPLMILFICGIFSIVLQRISLIKALSIIAIVMTAYLVVPSFGQIPSDPILITLKKQVGINFRHAEVPWHTIAVREWTTFAREQEEVPYIGTFLPPYFLYYYAGDDINYVPATPGQEFFYDKIDQSDDYATSLVDFYRSLLEDGNRVYVSSYYSTNISGWDSLYNDLVSNFHMDLAHKGCIGVCSLYELRLK